MADGDHERLAALLHGIEGMALISSYPSALYERLYGDWLMTGIDPAGIDLVGPVAGGLRVAFEEPVLTPGAARRALVELTAAARRRLGKS